MFWQFILTSRTRTIQKKKSTVPWLAGSAASMPGLADAGGLFLSVVPSSGMTGWAGGKLFWSLVGSSPGVTGEVLAEVKTFSGEVLSRERSRLGWGRNKACLRYVSESAAWELQQNVSSFSFCLTCFPHTLLGKRGRCPSGPRALCFSSRFLSLWSSCPSSLPASSGKTKTQSTQSLQWSIKALFN